MSTKRNTSGIVLITLAELAWLAAFALLFAYRSKVGELGRLQSEFATATNQQAQCEAKGLDIAKLSAELKVANEENKRLQERLSTYEKFLTGTTPEDAARRLAAAEKTEARLAEAEKELAQTKSLLSAKENAFAKTEIELRKAETEVSELRQKIAAIREEFAKLKQSYEAKIEESAHLHDETNKLGGALSAWESKEFSIRREITGLPTGKLHQVIILFDTSSSMTSSTAWKKAQLLVRVWLTYLPIEECVLIKFNNDVSLYPAKGFLRLREPDGLVLTNNQALLLGQIGDEPPLGTYTDTLKAFERAYTFKGANLILLFTDGKPKTKFSSYDVLAPQIYQLVGEHRNIPILAVGLGDYEKLEGDDKRASTNLQIQFLKRLADLSDGNFMFR